MTNLTTASSLRQRMLEDMASRQLSKGTQIDHIRAYKRFAVWLKRSPETATLDEVRLFQLHLIQTGTSIQTRNRTMCADTIPSARGGTSAVTASYAGRELLTHARGRSRIASLGVAVGPVSSDAAGVVCRRRAASRLPSRAVPLPHASSPLEQFPD
jgi:hypothetical protein